MHQNKDSEKQIKNNKNLINEGSCSDFENWDSFIRTNEKPIGNFWDKGELLRVKENLEFFIPWKEFTPPVDEFESHVPRFVEVHKRKEIPKGSVVMFIDGKFFHYEPVFEKNSDSKSNTLTPEKKRYKTRYILNVLYKENIASIEFDKPGLRQEGSGEDLLDFNDLLEKI